ncbi:hypothetical protein GF373_02395 [bacterium]|nr:hypothetical protein [bacterium]
MRRRFIMTEHLIAIGIFIVSAWLLWLLFWPDRGWFWRIKQFFQTTERVKIEDILKHVFEYETISSSAEKKAIFDHLNISPKKGNKLLKKMQERELCIVEDGSIQLTDKGREYAIQIVRAHRLWECFLCDKTGVKEDEWHQLAEKKEHKITQEEINNLSRLLGNPLYDPHGDPIPTAAGEYFSKTATPLIELNENDTAVIDHIEDEPRERYSELADRGLGAGMQIQVIGKTDDEIQLWAGGKEHTLQKPLAEAISIAPFTAAQQETDLKTQYRTLDTLTPGETATVMKISQTCRGLERRRLMDFGIVPGTTIVSELQAIGRDPVAYRVRNTLVSLRKEQASQILVSPPTEEAA